MDTGATRTLIDKSVFDQLQRPLQAFRGTPLKLANGSSMTPIGECRIKLKLQVDTAMVIVNVMALVADKLPFRVLLGDDFNTPAGVTVNCRTKKIAIDPRPEPTATGAQVFTLSEIVVPSRSVCDIPVYVKDTMDIRDKQLVVSSDETAYKKNRLIPANSLVENNNKGQFSIKVLNGLFRPVKLEAHNAIASYVVNKTPKHNVEFKMSDLLPQLEQEFLGFVSMKMQSTSSTSTDMKKTIGLKLNNGVVTIGRGLNELQREKLRDLLNEFIECFLFEPEKQVFGQCTMVKHHIDVGNARPINQRAPRVSDEVRKKLKVITDDLLQRGAIRLSQSPWCSRLVFVPKSNPNEKDRMCQNLIGVNAVTKRDNYKLPHIEDCLDTLRDAKVFSVMDCTKGYWQVQLTEESKELTAFATPDHLFEWEVMPFGLSNAPATFQRLMDVVLSGLRWHECLVYLDDIVVFSTDFDSHLVRLHNVLDRLRKAKLVLNPKKCIFGTDVILYLGHIIDANGRRMDPRKVEAVRNMPKPTTPRQLKSFLQFCNFYRKFIESFASVASPLYNACNDQKKLVWTPEMDNALDKLK